FKLILNVKDQYGNTISNLNHIKSDILVSVAGTHVISVNGYNATTNTANFETVTINGNGKVALALADLAGKGNAVVTFIPKSGGTSAQFTISVEEGLTYDKISLNPV